MADDLRAEIAKARGLPAELASRITGDTREQMEADADQLARLLPAPAAPSFDDAIRGVLADHAARGRERTDALFNHHRRD